MNDKMANYKSHYERVSCALLDGVDIPASRVREAMYYVLFPGGTLLRPLLVYLCGELFGVNLKVLDIMATSVELINCASMVHDDLPAMDDDEYRRSRLCCHLAFDEATAILVGDGMQMLAIDLLLTHLPAMLSGTKTVEIARVLTQASGVTGMVSGQSLDLFGDEVSEKQLQDIHELKAGKLISACIDMVLVVADASVDESCALKAFARDLGIVFQIHNDYLDYYGEMTFSGKKPSDFRNQKTTYTHFYDEHYFHDLFKKISVRMASSLSVFEEKNRDLLLLVEALFANQLHKMAPFAQTINLREADISDDK